MDRYKEIERTIITTYRHKLWHPFVKACDDYKLIKENDKIGVCISGGKDSFLLAKLLQELQAHGKIPFELEFITMDPGYSNESLRLIKENSETLHIPLTIFESNIFDVVSKETSSPCYLCARMRRGCLYKKAKELGCNKIALGHHFDDVVETVLISMFYGGSYKTMMPKLHSQNYPPLELIRPMYLIKEKDILQWVNYNHLEFIQCACKFTEKQKYEQTSKRKEIKELIKDLKKKYPIVDQNIFKSTHDVNLETIIGYHSGKEYTSFLDDFDNPLKKNSKEED